MEKEIEGKIIELYLSGVGSTTIAKQLLIPKQKILKLLKLKKLTRNRLHSEEFYSNFWEKDGKWWGSWKCNSCDKDITFSVNKKSLLHRNLKKKKVCKECSLDKQVGEGNPFYGKKHTDETIDKISKTKTGVSTSKHMGTEKYRELFSLKTKERWASGCMEETRVKLSNLLKQRIISGGFKSYNRSRAEYEIIEIINNIGIETQPNFIIDSKIFDIYIPKFNLLIEYNGDYWHCNPIKYKSDYFNQKKNKTAKEIWEYDENKLYLAKTNGYICEVIWEADYKKNKNIVLELIKKYETK